jgi:hypothetical protein
MPTMSVTPALREILERFDLLPDDAVVPTKVTSTIIGTSERTVRYHPKLPRVQVSEGRYGQRVGDIRKLCRGVA